MTDPLSQPETPAEARERVGFRWVATTLLRCLRLLRPVAGHVVALAAGYAAIALVLLPSVLILFDMFWTRALQGQPLTQETALAFGLDPAVASHVELLSDDLRRGIARTAIVASLVLCAVLIPVFLGLYYYQTWILQRVNQVLRVELLDRLQALSLRFHSENPVGDALYRVYQDSAMVTQLVDVLFFTPVSALLRFSVLLAILAAFDPRLAGVMLAVWPPVLLVGAWFSGRLRTGFRAAREANAALTSRIQETLVGIRVIKAYGAEGREQETFEGHSRAAFRAALSARTRLAVFGVGIFWIVGAALLIATAFASLDTRGQVRLALGASLAAAGLSAWNLGLYNAFKFFAGSAAGDVRVLMRTWGRTQDVAIGLGRVFELLDLEPDVREAPDAVPLASVRESVRFRGVRFRYQPDRPALEGIDLEASIGSVTAIVGPTGSGKSTLMALLLRLFDPDAGAIEIDGVDLRRFRLASLRERIAVALQENVLFGTTIRENIRYAVPDASDDAVREAARVACAAPFIEALPRGYDTPLGERGTKLSSGQRQRLSIARAVLKDPDVLILDEPTASLDAETELAVLGNLARWGRERALFLVTHRLSTIRRADRIAVLGDGRVVEQGTHAELASRPDGAYRALLDADGSAPVARAAAL